MNLDENYRIIRYDSSLKGEWNDFISRSKNGTFLLSRDYMDYHSDRFDDMSLMIYRKGKLYALLPANRRDNTLWSHQGLTYGGLMMDSKMTAGECIEVFRSINEYLKSQGIEKVVYKPTPYIYHKIPAQEDLYALFVSTDAILKIRCISSTIYEDSRLKFVESRKSGLRKALKSNLSIGESDDIDGFWSILYENLTRNHSVTPVHSSEELKLLMSRFPQNIKLYEVRDIENRLLGGTLIYVTDQVIHTQYISATDDGKYSGALDLLFDYLINTRYPNYKYFDFGHSTEDGGKILNNALIFQKEGFGGRGVCYDIYEYHL